MRNIRFILTIVYSVFVVLAFVSVFNFQQDILTYTYENLFKNCYELSRSIINICYPIESTFYPYPLYLLIALVVLIILVVLALRWIQKRLPEKIKAYFPKNIDTVALAGVIVSAIAIFGPLVVQTAILDYNVLGKPINGTNTELNIILGNFGLVAAKNVMISLNSNNTTVNFSDLISEPTISETTKFDTNKDGDATIKMGTLPPRSVTALKLDISGSSEAAVTTYIRADEAVGYHNSMLTYIFYGVVLAPVIIILIFKSLSPQRQEKITAELSDFRDLHTSGYIRSKRKVYDSNGKTVNTTKPKKND